MRNKFSLLIGLLLIVFSCTIDENEFVENEALQSKQTENETEEIVAAFSDSPNTEDIPLNEIIIKYRPGIPDQVKEDLKNQYGVISTKKCDCTNDNQVYELWIMDPNGNAEPTAKAIRTKEEGSVEFAVQNRQFNMPVDADFSYSEGTPDFLTVNSTYVNYKNKIKTSESDVTIAVLDTGVNVNLVNFATPFLHDSSQNGGCVESSGWDLVNNDAYPNDDDKVTFHGTMITYIIYQKLINAGIKFDILPVKVADHKGKFPLFNILCGIAYAEERGADVINLSLGWTNKDPEVYKLFTDLIDKVDAILVSSAGNAGLNNDTNPHYPSNYPQDHVLAIASSRSDLSAATGFTNYGPTGVDFFAPGDNILVPLRNLNGSLKVRGTSYSTSYGSAKVAEIISSHNTNDANAIRSLLDQLYGINVDHYNKYSVYMKHIN